MKHFSLKLAQFIFVVSAAISTGISCSSGSASDRSSSNGHPKLVVNKPVHDFGEVAEGDELGVVFWVCNKGDGPMLISQVKAGCGCTSVKWPKEPVVPGDSCKIDVIFNTKGKSGAQTKQVLVYSNATDAPFELMFSAIVK